MANQWNESEALSGNRDDDPFAERNRRDYGDRDSRHDQRSFGQNRYGQGRDSQNRLGGGYGQRGYGQNRSGQRDTGQGRYDEGGYGQGEYGQSRYGQDRNGPGGYGRNQRGDDGRDWMDRAGDEVRSWFGDDDADRRRDMDQHRGKGPKGYTRSDDRIREDVCDRLSDDSRTDASDIEVSVSGGEVTLSGTVTDRGSKRSAEDCVDRVSGVQHVQNNLRVKQSGSEGRNASAATAGAGQTATAAKA